MSTQILFPPASVFCLWNLIIIIIKLLVRQIDRDCKFLESEGIMDYSLLVGLHFRDDNTYNKMGLSPFLLRTGMGSMSFYHDPWVGHPKRLYMHWNADLEYLCSLQGIKIHTETRSLCEAVVFLKQSYKTWIEFYLGGTFLLLIFVYFIKFKLISE